jgi:hypothetical protein
MSWRPWKSSAAGAASSVEKPEAQRSSQSGSTSDLEKAQQPDRPPKWSFGILNDKTEDEVPGKWASAFRSSRYSPSPQDRFCCCRSQRSITSLSVCVMIMPEPLLRRFHHRMDAAALRSARGYLGARGDRTGRKSRRRSAPPMGPWSLIPSRMTRPMTLLTGLRFGEMQHSCQLVSIVWSEAE